MYQHRLLVDIINFSIPASREITIVEGERITVQLSTQHKSIEYFDLIVESNVSLQSENLSQKTIQPIRFEATQSHEQLKIKNQAKIKMGELDELEELLLHSFSNIANAFMGKTIIYGQLDIHGICSCNIRLTAIPTNNTTSNSARACVNDFETSSEEMKNVITN
ncbi:MAG: hypothetical protein QMC13_07285 [Colwellia sp.]